MERIKDGETVLMAEGYLFELERRGYLQASAFVPEVVLNIRKWLSPCMKSLRTVGAMLYWPLR